MTLTDEVLSYILKDFIEKEKSRKKLTVEEVQNCVCKKYAVSIQQILSPERTQSIVTPRQLAMYISRKFTTRSLPEIAKKFEKSHATIIHGVKNIAKRLDVEPELRVSLDEILNERHGRWKNGRTGVDNFQSYIQKKEISNKMKFQSRECQHPRSNASHCF